MEDQGDIAESPGSPLHSLRDNAGRGPGGGSQGELREGSPEPIGTQKSVEGIGRSRTERHEQSLVTAWRAAGLWVRHLGDECAADAKR